MLEHTKYNALLKKTSNGSFIHLPHPHFLSPFFRFFNQQTKTYEQQSNYCKILRVPTIDYYICLLFYEFFFFFF